MLQRLISAFISIQLFPVQTTYMLLSVVSMEVSLPHEMAEIGPGT